MTDFTKKYLFSSQTQIPSGLPPIGTAGGDLSGTYPNPTVIWTNGYTTYDTRYLMASDGVSSFNTRVGVVTLTSGDVTIALGYTPYNATNPSGYITSSYLTDTLINGKLLTGYISGAGTISASDSILQGIQKLNGNISALVTGVSSVNSLTGAIALTGTANRITISASNVFDISASYVGQSSITTLGTIGTGTWNGSVIGLTYGGTNANLTASNGGIFYSTASAGAILSGTATANKMLLSGATAAPTWSTSTIPTSAGATANKVLLSDGTNYVLSTPTFPNASATSGKIIISDGTNWVASTTIEPNSCTTGDLLYASASNTYSNLAAVAAGSYLRSAGTSTAPVWSTLILPNSATSTYLAYATATNTWGENSRLAFNPSGNGFMVQNAAGGTSPTTYFQCDTTSNTNIYGAVYARASSNATNNIKTTIRTEISSGGVAAAGLGGAIQFTIINHAQSSYLLSGKVTNNLYSCSTGVNKAKTSIWAADNTDSNVDVQVETISISATGVLINPSQTSTSTASALLEIAAGTASIGPLKLTSGTNLTTAVAGTIEYNGTNLFFTRSGTTRESVICANAVNTVSPTSPNRTIAVVIDGTTYYIAAKTTND